MSKEQVIDTIDKMMKEGTAKLGQCESCNTDTVLYAVGTEMFICSKCTEKLYEMLKKSLGGNENANQTQ